MDSRRNIIRELREKAGMEQKEVAAAIGVARPTVSDWERGMKKPRGENLFKMAELFNVSTGVILGYEDVPMQVTEELSSSDIQMLAYRDLVRRNPERGILFSMATSASISDVRRAVAIMKALETEEARDADTGLCDLLKGSQPPFMGQR